MPVTVATGLPPGEATHLVISWPSPGIIRIEVLGEAQNSEPFEVRGTLSPARVLARFLAGVLDGD